MFIYYSQSLPVYLLLDGLLYGLLTTSEGSTDVLLKAVGESSSVDNSLESFEVVQASSLGSQSDLLSSAGLFPLALKVELFDSSTESASSGGSDDGDLESGEGESLDWDDLSFNTVNGVFNEDSVFVEDIEDDNELSSDGTEVDEGDSADFDEVLIGH